MSDFSEDSDDDVYEVEKITNHVICEGETYYCVTWKGYEGPEAQTWEPKENLLSCEDLLNTYIASIQQEDKKRSDDVAKKKSETSDESDSDNEPIVMKIANKNEGSNLKQTQIKRGRGRGKGRGRGRGKSQGKSFSHSAFNHSSSSESDSSSDESPHVKDPFWEDLEMGKVNVFAEDLYSKVKRRRGPVADDQNTEITVLPSVTSAKKRGPKKKLVTEKNNLKKDVDTDPESVKSATDVSGKSILEVDSNDVDAAKPDNNDGQQSDTSPVLKYIDDQLLENNSRKEKKGKATKLNVDKLMKPILDEVEQSVSTETDKSSNNFNKDKTKADSTIPNEASVDENNLEKVTEKRTSPTDNIASEIFSEKEKLKSKGSSNEEHSLFSNVLQQLDKLGEKETPKKEKRKLNKSLDKPGLNQLTSDQHSSFQQGSKLETNKDKSGKLPTLKESPVIRSNSTDFSKKSGLQEKPLKSKDRPPSLSAPEKNIPDKKSRSRSVSSLKISSKPANKSQNNSSSNVPSSSSFSTRSSDNVSVFEAMQKELETSNFPTSKPQSSPEDTDASNADVISDEVVNDNVDMSEYLKVKVNFTLDEVPLKEIEQHHETGEPPCRLGREITNAEFRQYIRSNNFEMVYEILKSKARMYNLEHQDAMWMTQLMIASAAGYSEIVKVLAYHGARVNARTKSNQTALMFAAEKGHAITVRILLMYGAYVNLQTTSGETALMKATKGGHMSIVHTLLQAGADPCIKSPHGVSALKMEGRLATAAVALVKKYKQNVETTVDAFVRQTLQNLGMKVIGSSLFGVKTFNVREHALIYFTYNYSLKDLPTSHGVALFAVHGMVGAGLSVKCRMQGPCYVNAVTVNNTVMQPIMPSKETIKYSHFMTNVVWRSGQNSFRFFLAQDGLSREKLYICSYVVTLT